MIGSESNIFIAHASLVSQLEYLYQTVIISQLHLYVELVEYRRRFTAEPSDFNS